VTVRVLPFEKEGLPIHLSPNSLLAALWLQFVEAVNGNRKFTALPVLQAVMVLGLS
jgi:hypothetical protein